MTTVAKKPVIFISYAHADEPGNPREGEVQWLSFVTGFLKPAEKRGAMEVWVDTLVRGGDDWNPEIERKLRECDVFVLLVSRYSTSSDYVVDKEIAIIRDRQSNGEDVRFYPLLLTPTSEAGLDVVRDKNMRPRGGRPLSTYSWSDRDEQMAAAANEIADIAAEIAALKAPAAARERTLADSIGKRLVREPNRAKRESPRPAGIVADGSHDVFLSYASKDEEVAEAVCAALERNGISVWMASRNIVPGSIWAESIIVEGIDRARVAVLIFSDAANDSRQIAREVGHAIDEKNLIVVPFRIEDVRPKGALQYFIGSSHYIDAFRPPLEEHLERLVRVVWTMTGPKTTRTDAEPRS